MSNEEGDRERLCACVGRRKARLPGAHLQRTARASDWPGSAGARRGGREHAPFCGWGVRTVAATEARYNPMSYHNGSIWPHDNALIAAGFARYGFKREAARIFEEIFAASTYIDLRRLPELFCGFVRRHTRGPTFYPVACMPQAWAAAALFMLQSCLGLGFDLNRSHITFEGRCCLTSLARLRCSISPSTDRLPMWLCAARGRKSWSMFLTDAAPCGSLQQAKSPANNCFVSDRVKPRAAMSPRPPGRSISMTSYACPPPSAPIPRDSKSRPRASPGRRKTTIPSWRVHLQLCGNPQLDCDLSFAFLHPLPGMAPARTSAGGFPIGCSPAGSVMFR
jgi:hypothetical protein